MPKKYLIIVLSIFLILFISEIYILFINPKFRKKETAQSSVAKISPDILLLSEPIHWFTGTIEKIEGSTLFVNKSAISQLSKTYTLTFNANATIVQLPAPIPYSFKTVPVSNKTQVTVADLRIGQTITAISTADLRFLQSDTFEVNSIEIQSPQYPLVGTITKISENTLDITGHLIHQQSASPEPTKEEVYKITVSQDTEIHKLSAENTTAPKKLNFSDLTVGQMVSVYSDKEILPNQTTSALLVQQLTDTIISTAPPLISASPSGSTITPPPLRNP